MATKIEIGTLEIDTSVEQFFETNEIDPKTYIDRHAICDYGNLNKHGINQNEIALRENKNSIISYYKVLNEEIVIITNIQKSKTIVVFASMVEELRINFIDLDVFTDD